MGWKGEKTTQFILNREGETNMTQIAMIACRINSRIECFKVGGMRFIKVRYWGDWKVCISICTTTK